LSARRLLSGLKPVPQNAACRGEGERALALYNTLTKEQKDQIPQQLRVWLRYRSEKYFGTHRTPPKSKQSRNSAFKSIALDSLPAVDVRGRLLD
jgi:hypothetical protein